MKPKAIRDEEKRQEMEHLAPDLDPADMLEEDEEEYRAGMDKILAEEKAREEKS